MDDLQSHWCEEYSIIDKDDEVVDKYFGTDPTEIAEKHSRKNNTTNDEYIEVLTVKSASGMVTLVEVEAEATVEYSTRVLGGA